MQSGIVDRVSAPEPFAARFELEDSKELCLSFAKHSKVQRPAR